MYSFCPGKATWDTNAVSMFRVLMLASDASVMINSAPSDMIISNSYYTLAGSSQDMVCSQLYGNVYSCQITVLPVLGCDENTPALF